MTREPTQQSDQTDLDAVTAPDPEEIPLRRDKLVVKSGLKAGGNPIEVICGEKSGGGD
jgi:hypothetical protein